MDADTQAVRPRGPGTPPPSHDPRHLVGSDPWLRRTSAPPAHATDHTTASQLKRPWAPSGGRGLCL